MNLIRLEDDSAPVVSNAETLWRIVSHDREAVLPSHSLNQVVSVLNEYHFRGSTYPMNVTQPDGGPPSAFKVLSYFTYHTEVIAIVAMQEVT